MEEIETKLALEGDILARDIYYNNTLLLVNGSVITDRLKEKLMKLGVNKSYIETELEKDAESISNKLRHR